ncbi:MAG TPA: autotransporter outer membrane beta-barrel domain-containing protein [Steroidobacteraceae bacterium]|nr:autotransporter outer membrane beta-barrel domain-containing protein [Steroidobacteraceae bacterium]
MDGIITAGIGGFGGAGGTAGAVNATATTDISAVGTNAIGFFAQSLGGGGGNGGINISGGIQGSSDTDKPTLNFGIGGFGGAGNVSSTVDATQRGNVNVQGRNSIGVLAQSVAGGGGAGGLNVTGSLVRGKGYNASIGIGGSAGDGADAGRVTLTSDGNVRVDGSEAPESDEELTAEQIAALEYREHATGVLVQSIGGGGGAGGMNLTGLIAPMGKTLTVGVGGSGGGGGDAGEVYVERGQVEAGLIETFGNASGGLIAQSIGGGGGNAGVNMMYSESSDQGRAINLGVGGNGGTPGVGKQVDVLHTGDITTHGNRSFGLLAQSVGGGGGSADYNVSDNKTKATAVNIAIGGSTGPGGDAGEVLVKHAGDISTEGDNSIAIFAQSVGGGGGSTGTDMVASSDSEKGLTVSMGRAGGTGGDGGQVRVESDGTLSTEGWRAFGIYAQSVGGGGGESSSNSIEVLTRAKQEGSDKAASLEVGIAGATGGVARDVDVTAHGGIFTKGDDSHAIFAQSTGGGGGSGGGIERQPAATASQQIVVGVGGSGGDGGIGGAVDVDSDADIETEGEKSHGIYAQSVGGGGGTGGYTAAVDLSPDSEGPVSRTVAISLGGEGGTGSYSSTVDVTNRGNIVTHGRESHGINAESTGGGGGAGGAVLSISTMSDDTAQALSLNVGGKGGIGGTSDDVTVLNEGSIETEGDNSVGVRARSVGGKGGDGGLVLNMGLLKATPGQKVTRVSMSVGGDGAIGGEAGDVEVTNRAQADAADTGVIITHGRESHGVFAQSIGGGGGNGSSVLSSTLGVSMSAQVTVLDMSLGGKGGQGSKAGNVTVTNDSVIDTEGDEAHGIFAQSVGGGGGNGGLVLAANALLAAGEPASEGLLTIGGAGGTGDDAGDVTVNNNGRIVTRGDHAHGIFAQSIGGGGGNAGVGFGASLNPGTMAIAGTMSALFGGQGGEGGLGGHVTVNHTGDITVLGNGSRAVVAESINGGGGEVVLDFNGVATLPGVPDQIYNVVQLPQGIEPTSSLQFFGGGDHQGSSNAGQVTLNLHGTFGVVGDNGAANSVQAVGGGGGTYDLELALHDTEGTADDVTLSGRLGGISGTDNRGGDIASTHDGDLVTEGDNTVGAIVQSIGGGGGRANLDVSSTFGSLGDTTLTLGGADGTHEEGGDIDHAQAGATSTQGTASHGGVFQSVGGGGGTLALMVEGGTQTGAAPAAARERRIYKASPGKTAQGVATAGTSKIDLGSHGGTQLKGGQVSLQLDGGISTQGDHASGLVFQSVGAGGGVATVLGVDALDVTLGGAANASGDGGSLAVVNTGDVITAGERAHGVFLQSIGGGGGAVFTNATTTNVTLSAQNSGSGGNLSFTQNGSIATQGALAYAVFAQSVGGGGGFVDASFAGSAGGSGGAGSIDLVLDGDVLAFGEGSTGLFAQSTGADGLGGNITATLAAGKRLFGGTNGIAVQFDGGAANRFTNYGSLATLSSTEGLAFRGGAGGDSIDNRGALMGNIDLGGGANAFANQAGATLYSGTLINLGDPSNVFTNDGLISPGADRLAVETQLSGSYVQASTGVADMEIDLTRHVTDRVFATGTASVGGRINLSFLDTHRIRSGTTWQPLFSGARGVANTGAELHAPESIVINYDLYRMPTELGVAYDVDFAAHGKLSGNRAAVGEYLNRVTSRGDATGVGDVIATAVAQTNIDVYADMLTQLDTEFYAEQQALALGSAQRFARNLQNCGTLGIGETVGDENGCLWARYDDNPSSREAVNGFPAADSTGFSISTGLQRPLDGGWVVGVAVDIENHDSRGYDDLWTAEGKFVELGGSARRGFGAGSFGATLQIGNQSQDVTRRVGVTGVYDARGSRDVHFITSVLDYTWNFDVAGFSVQPSVNLGTSLLSYGDMTEQGAGGQNAVIAGGDESHLWIEPAVGARYTATFTSGASLRTFLRAGVLQYLSGTSTGVHAGLAGAPDYADYVRIGSDLDRTHVVGEAGLQYQAAGGFTFGLSYSHQQSDFREGGAGSLRFALPLK